jgi:hypothetical protein
MKVEELIDVLSRMPSCAEVSVAYDGYYNVDISIYPYVNKDGGVTIAEVTDENKRL